MSNLKEELNKISSSLIDKCNTEECPEDVKDILMSLHNELESSSSMLYLLEDYLEGNKSNEELVQEWNCLDQEYNLTKKEE